MAAVNKELPDVLSRYQTILEDMQPMRPMGKIQEVSGISLISNGPPEASVGDICRVERANNTHLDCEVVGFRSNKLILMPLGTTTGVHPQAAVYATGERLSIHVGEDMLGRIFDGVGRPLDSRTSLITGNRYFADNDPPSPTDRDPIRKPLETGVRVLDGLLTAGRGQRLGIFAGTGVGKSTLLGMIARYTRADINVICLVGERGREVKEFIENDLGEEGLKKSVIFVATSDRSAMEKVYAAGFATSAAEYFRSRGLHVNLLMDSVTRYCMALRDIGISTREPPGAGGYPPGVWFALSRLVERSGTTQKGSITGFYTVLVEADDMNEPVSDNTRGILDGHIVLSRRLAQKGHYPSVEVTESISRVMERVTSAEHMEAAARLRSILAAYRENEEMINLGAYARGSNPEVDFALERMPVIESFLKQRIEDGAKFEETIQNLMSLFKAETEEDYY